MSSENYYDILGVSSSANEQEIRKAYYEKAKMYHPDVYQGESSSFDRIKMAYQELLNPLRRASHDQEIGIERNFGESALADDFAMYRKFHRRRAGSIFRIFIKPFRSFFKACFSIFKSKKEEETFAQEENVTFDSNKVSLAIYTEQSFPIGHGEKIMIAPPAKEVNLQKCIDILKGGLSNYTVIKKAVLIEVRLDTLPDEKVYLISLEKQPDPIWGISDLKAVEVENYADDLPGMLLVEAGAEGPFAEAINLYGLEFYPSINPENLN